MTDEEARKEWAMGLLKKEDVDMTSPTLIERIARAMAATSANMDRFEKWPLDKPIYPPMKTYWEEVARAAIAAMRPCLCQNCQNLAALAEGQAAKEPPHR